MAVIGVNQFVLDEEEAPEVFRPEARARQEIHHSLQKIREERDDAQVKTVLEALKNLAATDTPLGPAILEAVEAYATVGEICETLGEVFPPYQPPSSF